MIELLPVEAQIAILGSSAAAASAGAHFWGVDELVDGELAPAARVVPKGFDTGERLIDHVASHGEDFGVVEHVDYNQLSTQFFAQPLNGLLEKIRFNGDVVRLDPSSGAFGVMRADGITRTFYKLSIDYLRGNGYQSFIDYFNAQ